MFPVIKNIKIESPIRLMPGITKISTFSEKGGRHLVVFGETDPLSCVLLGKIIETTTGADLTNANLWLSISRPRVGLIFGRRGTGKSYDLGVVLEALASENNTFKLGKYCPPVVVFDPLNQFWTLQDEPDSSDPEETQQLEEMDKWGIQATVLSNVRILVPRGTPRRHPDAIEFSIQIASLDIDDWCGFFQVNKYTDPMGQLFSAAFDKVTTIGYQSVNHGEVAPVPRYDLDDLLNCIREDVEINDPNRGFHSNTIRAVTTRLAELRRTPIFSGTSDMSIQDVFCPGMISIFMLRDVDEATRGVVVSQIVKKIVKARAIGRDAEEIARRIRIRAQSLSNQTERDKLEQQADSLIQKAGEEGVASGWIVLDEAHTICPASGETAAREVIIELAKQGRHLGLSLLAATQQPSALSTKLCSQRDFIILHNLGIKQDVDAGLSLLNPNFPSAIGSGREQINTNIPSVLLNSLGRGEAIFSVDEVNRNFLIRIRPRATAHGGKEPIFI